jgi:hypothetical protein
MYMREKTEKDSKYCGWTTFMHDRTYKEKLREPPQTERKLQTRGSLYTTVSSSKYNKND